MGNPRARTWKDSRAKSTLTDVIQAKDKELQLKDMELMRLQLQDKHNRKQVSVLWSTGMRIVLLAVGLVDAWTATVLDTIFSSFALMSPRFLAACGDAFFSGSCVDLLPPSIDRGLNLFSFSHFSGECYMVTDN